MKLWSARSLTKASFDPSGDHRGLVLVPAARTSGFSPLSTAVGAAPAAHRVREDLAVLDERDVAAVGRQQRGGDFAKPPRRRRPPCGPPTRRARAVRDCSSGSRPSPRGSACGRARRRPRRHRRKSPARTCPRRCRRGTTSGAPVGSRAPRPCRRCACPRRGRPTRGGRPSSRTRATRVGGTQELRHRRRLLGGERRDDDQRQGPGTTPGSAGRKTRDTGASRRVQPD